MEIDSHANSRHWRSLSFFFWLFILCKTIAHCKGILPLKNLFHVLHNTQHQQQTPIQSQMCSSHSLFCRCLLLFAVRCDENARRATKNFFAYIRVSSCSASTTTWHGWNYKLFLSLVSLSVSFVTSARTEYVGRLSDAIFTRLFQWSDRR